MKKTRKNHAKKKTKPAKKIVEKAEETYVPYKSAIAKKEEKPVAKKYKTFLSEKKLNHLLKIGDVEEFYYLANILKENEIEAFIEHYKLKKPNPKENRISAMIHRAKTPSELLDIVKSESANHLKERYDDLKKLISEKRKKGKDVYVPDIKLMSVPLKIKIYLATMEKKDFYKVKKMLDDIQAELEKIIP